MTTWEVAIMYVFKAEDAQHAVDQFENALFGDDKFTDYQKASIMAHLSVCQPIE